MKIRRTLLVSAATAGLMTAGLASASAHVTVEPADTAAGAFTVLTFAASHGCEGSPTTSFTINIPDTIADAKPTVYPGWHVKKVKEKLPEPVTTAEGTTITEHIGQIVYTAKTPLEDGYRMAFEVQVQNPDKAGETLAFPVLQACEKGETDWAELPAEDQDPHELKAPAPTYALTAAPSGDAHGAGTADPASLEGTSPAAQTSDNGAAVAAYVGLGAGVLGLGLGGIALTRTRKTAR